MTSLPPILTATVEQQLLGDLVALQECIPKDAAPVSKKDESPQSPDSCCLPKTPHLLSSSSSELPASPLNATFSEESLFQMGDHVYRWCSWAGIPAVYQHHAIVTDVFWRPKDAATDAAADDDDSGQDGGRDGEWRMKLADFVKNEPNEHDPATSDSGYQSTVDSQTSSLGRTVQGDPTTAQRGRFRTYEVSCVIAAPRKKATWHKVEYCHPCGGGGGGGGGGWWKKRKTMCDAPGLVRARVQFLIECGADALPPYHAVTANGECAAVWCKTGTWATLQAIHWLTAAALGQTKSAGLVTAVAATTQVTVPAAGLWGWLGYTTQASLLSTQPYLWPAIAVYGVVTVGVPTVWLLRAKQQGKHITMALNAAFWEQAVEYPGYFAECITEWSAMVEANGEEIIIELIKDDDESTALDNLEQDEVDSHPVSVVAQSPQHEGRHQHNLQHDNLIMLESSLPASTI